MDAKIEAWGMHTARLVPFRPGGGRHVSCLPKKPFFVGDLAVDIGDLEGYPGKGFCTGIANFPREAILIPVL